MVVSNNSDITILRGGGQIVLAKAKKDSKLVF